MQEIRLIALDLDNTTLNRAGELSEPTRAAIVKALDANIHVVVASGRSFHSLPAQVVSIPRLRYAITSNGAAVYDLADQRVLHRVLLQGRTVERILELVDPSLQLQGFLDGQGYAAQCYLDDPKRYSGAGRVNTAYLQATRIGVQDIRSFILKNRDALDMVDIVMPDPKEKEQLRAVLERALPDAYLTTSAAHLVEIVHRDCGKRSGVAWLADFLKIDAKQVAAFGDAENDRDMIEYAGLGCAVENAVSIVKEAADLIVPSNEEDGVAVGIERILGGNGRKAAVL